MLHAWDVLYPQKAEWVKLNDTSITTKLNDTSIITVA